MKFILLNRDTGTGGLQTAMLRMARWLHQSGHHCVVLTATVGNLTPLIAKFASVIKVGYPEYYGLATAPEVQKAIAEADCVHTFSWDSLILGLRIARELDCALIVGVYHPRAFNFFPIAPRPYYAEFHRELFRGLNDRNILFMNENTRSTNQVDFNRTFTQSLLLPVPVELPQRQVFRSGARRPFRLLSVGRLVNFKRYPIGVCQMLAAGRWSKERLQFSVYGEGPHRVDMEELVTKSGLQEQVFLGGEIPYAEFPKIILEHDGFIGMGTSALEAAARGLPTVVAPAYGDGRFVNGFFHEQTGYNYGENAGDRPTEGIIDNLLAMNDRDLQTLGDREHAAAKNFSAETIMPVYLAHLARVKRQPQVLPPVPKTNILRSVFSGVMTTQIPILNQYWRKHNWHHPAQDR